MLTGAGDDKSHLFHRTRSLLLLLLNIAFLPASLFITSFAICLQFFGFNRPETIQGVTRNGTSKKILITGVGMGKGLFLARTMHLGGCIVYGADFDQSLNFHCGRFSRALRKFYALKHPSKHGLETYITQVVDLIHHEGIDLWISCSGVATAIEDARLAQAIEESTACRAFQLNEQAVSLLDDKLNFMKKTSELGLSNLNWHSLASPSDVKKLIQQLQSSSSVQNTKYIIKCASMDDSTRGALPILRSNALGEMQRVLSGLSFEQGRIWILQEFVDSGEEYCTQALIINDRVAAFTACRSDSVLMHYTQLDPNSILFKQMLRFTHDYAIGLSKETGPLTGHLSFDFLVRYQETEDGLVGTLAPIECNPRCHTATVLFRGLERDLASCYLAVLQTKPSRAALIGNPIHQPGFYWMAHDIVTLIVIPLLRLMSGPSMSLLGESFQQRAECLVHFANWKDPTFEWWDPLPWLLLNHFFWPMELLLAAIGGTRWKEINVSTTKVFRC